MGSKYYLCYKTKILAFFYLPYGPVIPTSYFLSNSVIVIIIIIIIIIIIKHPTRYILIILTCYFLNKHKLWHHQN